MKQYLVTWDANFADEMDISGFVIMIEDEWNEFKDALSKRKKEFSLSIGTNEDIEYENGEELLDELTPYEITEAEVSFLTKTLGDSYGFTAFLRAGEYDESEYDEDEDDDDFEYDDEDED
jgi:hypothetical protein